MREALECYNQLKQMVQKKENYVPRNYQTVGGRWTTDVYKLGDVTCHIMDEGYSSRLFGVGFDAWGSYRNGGDEIEYKVGGTDELQEATDKLKEVLTHEKQIRSAENND